MNECLHIVAIKITIYASLISVLDACNHIIMADSSPVEVILKSTSLFPHPIQAKQHTD